MGLVSSAPIRSGDTWACVTAKGRGQPVKIKTVTTLNVQFRAFGRDADERTHSMPIDLFRMRYVPLSDVGERQRAIQHDEKRNGGPILVERQKETVPLPEPEPTIVTQETPAAPEPKKKRHTGRRDLSPGQIREIFDLMQAAPTMSSKRGAYRREVAETYGLLVQNVYDIETGRAYSWVTGIERRPKSNQEEPTVPPAQIPAPRTPLVNGYQSNSPEGQLLLDMADALELLLEYAGRPLPKYLNLDTASISGLVDRARGVAQ